MSHTTPESAATARTNGAGAEPRSFESRLIHAIQPLRSYALAIMIHHLFETGLFDALASAGRLSPAAAAEPRDLDAARVKAFFSYLRNEGVLEEAGCGFALSAEGRALADFRPWYTMLVGGYAETFLQMGEKIRAGSGWASRDLARVGDGSCGISHHDAIPVTRRLMAKAPGQCTRLLDMGCGNGRYLVEFCQALPEIEEAWGVEPSAQGCREAEALIARHGLGRRVRIVHSGATEFLERETSFAPNFVVLGFVLHEILGQEGEAGVRRFLTQLTERFPGLHLIVIEVDQRMDDPAAMHHGLGLAYYNPYYLLHAFTPQRLEPLPFWERLFAECGLAIVAKEGTDPGVDSTGLEVGYLLRKRTS